MLNLLGELKLTISRPFVRGDALPPSGSAYDGGGDVLAYEKSVRELIKSGELYVAPITCKSAATMLLKAPNVVWRPRAALYVHSASAALGGGFVDPFNKLIASHYPPRLRRWFLEDGPGKTRSAEFVRIPIADIVEVWGGNIQIRPDRLD